MDLWQGVDRLVVVDVTRGVSRTRATVKLLDTSQIVDLWGCKQTASPSDFERWSEDPGILVHVTDIESPPDRKGYLRLYFRPGPCLRVSTLDVAYEGSFASGEGSLSGSPGRRIP